MKSDNEHWKEMDINIDSLWIIGPRSGKRENIRPGNFAPQIPDHPVRRYTVVSDIYRDGEVIPLGFYMMHAVRKHIKCKLKRGGIVVKDIVGNKGKQGMEALWRYGTLKSDASLFRHEYISVFKK